MYSILSYPRSGQHWLRYILKHHDIDFDYSHDIEDIDSNTKLLFLVRNYKECIVRNHREGFGPHDIMLPALPHDQKKQLWLMLGTCFQTSYVAGLQYYHNFSGLKHIVYYEDLIQSPEITINEIATFVNIDISEFLNNLQQHSQLSIAQYPTKSWTQGTRVLYHSNDIPPPITRLWDDTVARAAGDLYDIYLKRYNAKEQATDPSIKDWQEMASILNPALEQDDFVAGSLFEDN